MASRPYQLEFPLSVAGRSLPPMEASTAQGVPERQKELGAFYTPPSMASVLADWAIRTPTDRVLDPSFGGLAFLNAAADRLLSLGAKPNEVGARLYGVDLDPSALEGAGVASHLSIPSENLSLRDFFSVDRAELPPITALVGNPPYVRYQGFNRSAAVARDLMQIAGVRLTRLASSWAPFVIHGTAFVAPGGRMAQVLPAELLHAQYADEVLAFLRRNFGHVGIAAFEERVFPGALEEVVLLFADERGADQVSEVGFQSFQTFNDLDVDRLTGHRRAPAALRSYVGGRKLLAQLVSDATRDLLDQVLVDGRAQELGDLASVDIGVVTGANEFFMLTSTEAEEMPEILLRAAVSKAQQVAGIRISAADHESLLADGQRGLMFVADKNSAPAAIADAEGFLSRGVEAGLHERYKCRVRDPWWALPLPKGGVPHILLTYCSGEHPRLVANQAGVLNTNTLHGVRLNDPTAASTMAAGFVNSLTLLSAELVGRSYGGGVLKLEPSEAEQVLIPQMPDRLRERIDEVDALIRTRDLERALDIVDPLVLGEGLRLSAAEITQLRTDGERLRTRRRSRGAKPRR